MSVSTELTRIITARNTLRTKAVALGIGLSTDDLSALATKYSNIVDRGTPSAQIREGETYTILPGYYQGGTVLGISGGGSYSLQAKTATPSKQQQLISPDSGYYGLSSVTVNAIPAEYQDVSDVTAVAAHVLTGDVFVTAAGVVTAGAMANNGAVTVRLDTENTSYAPAIGYHNGNGSVSIVLESARTVTPGATAQTISPESGKVLSSVVVNAIPGKYGDATNKTVSAANLLYGVTAIGWDSVNAVAVAVTGTMPNNGAVAPAALTAGGSYTIPAGYHNGSGVVSAATLASQTGVDTGKTAIDAGAVLTGYQGWVNGSKISGNMPNNGAVSPSALAAGGSYTIPAGYHNGSGVVSAASLASQTGVDAGKTAIAAAQVLAGYQGWVNGSKVSGSMANLGNVSATITGLGTVTGDTSVTIAAGYTSGGTISLTSDIENALAAI